MTGNNLRTSNFLGIQNVFEILLSDIALLPSRHATLRPIAYINKTISLTQLGKHFEEINGMEDIYLETL